VATADIQDSTRDLAREKGARSFVTKPFSGDEILAALKTALGDHSQ
jgi:CheY-like chemotaxis protein